MTSTVNRKNFIEKADLALSDLASNGLQTPELQNRFFQRVIQAPTMLPDVRFVPMVRDSMVINKLGFSQRVLHRGLRGSVSTPEVGEAGGRALARANRATPDFGQVVLNTQEIQAEINLPYEVLESIVPEGGDLNTATFNTSVMDMFAQAAARDLETLLIQGDSTISVGTDDLLSMMDGVVKMSTSNIVDNGYAGQSPELYANMFKAMPVKYHPRESEMIYYVPTVREIDYRTRIAQRQTALGDATLVGKDPVYVLGKPLRKTPAMPLPNAILTIPRNILMGVQRNLTIEHDKNIRERVFIVVLTMSVAFAYEEEDLVVKGINIGDG